MGGRTALLAATVAAALAGPASQADADHHLIQIREVYPGTNAAEDVEFVEIQMYASAQGELAAFARLDMFGANGALTASFENLNDAAFDGNQRTFLFGNDPFGVVSDFGYNTDELDSEGGAVCFNSTLFGSIDCVSWGSVTSPPAATGTPAPAIPDGSSLERSIARGCATLLEAADDTDDSVADFEINATPTPRANSTAPIERPCPNTTITGKPPKRTTKRLARFRFTATQGVTDFRCKLDSAPYAACTSPLSKRVKRGRHTFRVQAEGDSSPASYSWKVVKRRRR